MSSKPLPFRRAVDACNPTKDPKFAEAEKLADDLDSYRRSLIELYDELQSRSKHDQKKVRSEKRSLANAYALSGTAADIVAMTVRVDVYTRILRQEMSRNGCPVAEFDKALLEGDE